MVHFSLVGVYTVLDYNKCFLKIILYFVLLVVCTFRVLPIYLVFCSLHCDDIYLYYIIIRKVFLALGFSLYDNFNL